MKGERKSTAKFKMVSFLLLISIISQITMQVVLPLKSFASDSIEKSVTTELAGDIKLVTTKNTSINTNDEVTVDVIVTGSRIVGFEGYIVYDYENVFNEIDTSSITTPFRVDESSEPQEEGYFISVRDGNNVGATNSTMFSITFVAKAPAEKATVSINGIWLTQQGTPSITDYGPNDEGYDISIEFPREKEKFTITYNDPSGESTDMPEAGIKKEGESYTIASAPTRTGYRFTEWNTEADGSGVPYSAGATYTTDANLILYAQWEEIKGTLVVDPNGGVWEGKSTTQTIEQKIGTTKAIANPDPTKTPNGNVIQFNANGGETETLSITQTTTFEKWELTGDGSFTGNTYTFAEGTGTLTAKYKGDKITLPNATKAGATIDGWYTEATGGTKVGEPGKEWTPDSSRTLFIHWNEIEYTLTVNLNGGKAGESTTIDPIKGNYNETVTLPTVTGPEGFTVTLNSNYESGTTNTIKQTQRLEKWITEDGTEITGTTYRFGEKNDTVTAQYVREAVTLTAPAARPGYRFDGWYTAATGGTKVNNEYEPTGDIELFAHWIAETYTITFNPGESATVNPTSKQVTYGQTYGGTDGVWPTPTKPGGKFLGWYKGETQITADSIVDITGPITLVARWEGEVYQLTLNLNGGKVGESTTVTPITGNYNETVTLPTVTAPEGFTVRLNSNYEGGTTNTIKQTQRLEKWITEDGTEITGTTYTFGEKNDTVTAQYASEPVTLETLTRPGYRFDGWYTAVTGGTKVNNEYEPTGNIELFAHWTAEKYTITFNPGENATVNPTSKEVTYGQEYGTLPVPQRPGYEFNGWYNPGGEQVTAQDIVEITNDITLTAKWLGAEYTVTFDYGDGEGTQQSKTVRNEGTYGELPEATKEGHDFDGWFDDDGNKIESTTIVNLTEDITLHARYTPKQFTIIFKNDDGSVLEQKTANYGSTVTYTGETPEKEDVPAGYTALFKGWDNELKLQNIKENVTLVATYSLTPITYTIKYQNTKNADNSQNPVSYTVETENIVLKDLANQGKYIFKGWYTEAGETGTQVTSIDTSKAQDITLYAHWENDGLYLKSKYYKIGENDIDIYEPNDVYLDKIAPETTLTEFINKCETNGDITVINENGQTLQADDLVGTNMTIKVTRYDEEITLTAVVMGDLDGNGLVTPSDLSDINQIVLKVLKVEGAKFKAADIDDNKKITPSDLSDVNRTVLGVSKLIYIKK